MARKTQKDAARTRTRILASALALFTRKGYDHTTFTDIAARLKMTKGAVYWHFASKEALLVALVDQMLEKFNRDLRELFPKGELTFPAVAEMLVKNARQLTEDPRGTAFFLLVHEQIRWASASMTKVRNELLTGSRLGPFDAFRSAVGNDIAAGRVKKGTNPEQVAHICISFWEGLVHAHIAQFMRTDLIDTMQKAFAGVWQSIQA